jgi:hypothetical protein
MFSLKTVFAVTKKCTFATSWVLVGMLMLYYGHFGGTVVSEAIMAFFGRLSCIHYVVFATLFMGASYLFGLAERAARNA